MMQNIIELEQRFGAQNYLPLPVVLSRGSGVYLWDVSGKRYLDLMSAYSAVSHGHCHPRLVAALTQQAQQLAVISRAFYSDRLAALLQKVCTLIGLDKALPMNSGAEAVETALKAARKWAYTVKGVEYNRAEIIACRGNFHGRTLAIVGMSTEPQYQAGFGPFSPGFRIIPYGDSHALEQAITSQTAAFLVEPIQGEAGIILPPEGYLRECAAICKRHNVLMIVDEIQCGLGRTGRFLAIEHEGVKPDAVILGKALGGGLLPISMFVARQDVMDVFTPGDHGSTFGGNPLAATVALEALKVMEEEDLITRSAGLGDYFLKQLQTLKSPLIKDVRGRGLFIGVEMDISKVAARTICLQLMEKGILTKETHETVIRFAPPLVITKEQIDVTVQALQAILANRS